MSVDRSDNIVGLVFSDKAGTLNIEQSIDGTNWDYNAAPVAVAAGVGTGFTVPLYGAYVRLRYVNGAAAQVAFRIGARFSSAGRQG